MYDLKYNSTELLVGAKERLLLENSLEALHRECTAWLSTIDFWKDENTFYKDLLNNRLFQNVTNKDRDSISALMDKVVGDKLNVFKAEILVHEHNLDVLLQTKLDEGNYRSKHRLLLNRFSEFETNMKEIKTGVFELLRLVNENFFNGNETLHTIWERRSVRKFQTKSIDKHFIEKMISAGRMAPSSMNKQPWKFYVLTNKTKIQIYSQAIVKCAKDDLQLAFIEKSKYLEDPIFYHAPVVLFITVPKDNDWASIDVGMCSQNIMLAAKSMGFDSCPVGLARLIEKTPIYHELKVPDTEQIKLAIVVGYGDEKPVLHKRINDNLFFLN